VEVTELLYVLDSYLRTFSAKVINVNSSEVILSHTAFYPGGGGELYIGPVGLRLDVGDFIYWNNGTHNNLAVTFGPHIKF